MLGPPNDGSPLTDLLHQLALFHSLFGPASQQLTTEYAAVLREICGKIMNEARNALSGEARTYKTGLKRLEMIPSALRESMKAVEKIESIKIFDAGGLVGTSANGGIATASFGENLSGHLLRYQYNAPILDALLGEAGFSKDGNSVQALVGGVRDVAGRPAPTIVKAGDPLEKH